MSARTIVLQAEKITKSYNGRTIIQDISITLERGELVCLLGVSGAGKTTLFHVLSGLEPPNCGRVLLEGEDVTSTPGKISYMLQHDLLLPHKKVIDNVALPLNLQGKKLREARETALSYFSQFGLDGTQNQYPAQLSGGMRQRGSSAGRTCLRAGRADQTGTSPVVFGYDRPTWAVHSTGDPRY